MRPTILRGARTHNLRAIDLALEPGTLVAVAGPSGAGKSSLAFGTLYAEGQRRYVESFSAYARQFLERLARPPVDLLEPIPATIAVDRQAPVRTSRSTVGTMTEIADYAKALWARIAVLQCPDCERPVTADTPEGAAAEILSSAPDARVIVTYPIDVHDAAGFVGVREELVKDGYRRVVVAGEVVDLDEVRPSDVVGEQRARIDVVADRTVARAGERSRLVEALEAAMHESGGRADVLVAHVEEDGAGSFRFSTGLHCAHCDRSFPRATPGMFSFNSPIGACDTCRGFGRTIGVDVDRVIPDRSVSLKEGAVRAFKGKSAKWERRQLVDHARKAGIPLDVPVSDLSAAQLHWLVEGDEEGWPHGWFGIRGWFKWLESRAYKMHVRVFLSRYRKYERCVDCGGARLKPAALWWRVRGHTLPDFYALPVDVEQALIEELAAEHDTDPATSLLLKECGARLSMLVDVGLGYLTLDRASRTLSGGEAQRVALTSALGASLTGAMFVLDEPTVGLHPRDVARLFSVVKRLARGDNIAIVVEHDPAVLRGVDRVVELGPGAGELGGRIVFDGTPEELAAGNTATGTALNRRTKTRRQRRTPDGFVVLRGATGNNLRGVDVSLPAQSLTCVTGPSGSGKSTLVSATLVPAVRRALGGGGQTALSFESLAGAEQFAALIEVDQAPLGRTSRGNPATYLKAWDAIRKRFCKEPLAKERGYKPGFFSFNVVGGRCEACRGEGAETVEMQFLADVTFSCPECNGRRFGGPVLDVVHQGMTIADVLGLTAVTALERFSGAPDVVKTLTPMVDVGLGYLRLGQPLNTLSGGEAQRLKLAEALSRSVAGSLLVLDEPTAGLHADDVTPLLAVLDRLVDRGDTVVVVEHDMRVAAHADQVIDLGPGAGERGGQVVAAGTPEEVAAAATATSPFLAEELGLRRPRKARVVVDHEASTPVGTDIEVVGAREHNLRDVTIDIPREQLVVVTGPSGSGKSTLAFDVVYAEGQRRYLETLSPYARQYLPQLPRPSVDRVSNIPPSVSLEQRTTRGGSNSTVATVTEVAHFLRLLWARVGLLHCPDCDEPIAPRSAEALANDLQSRFEPKRELLIAAPYIRSRKGIHRVALSKARRKGFEEAFIDGELRKIEPSMTLSRYKEHDVDLVVARVRAADASLRDILRRALSLGAGTARVRCGRTDLLMSSVRACASCGTGFPELDPRFFSFNTRQGACESCEGRGEIVVTRGRGRNAREETSFCEDCEGTRLSGLARGVTVADLPITEVLAESVESAFERLEDLEAALSPRDAEVAEAPLSELRRRLSFLSRVGLGYLGLDRRADTLSGGELQRVRLAAQLGAGLTGVLYVLDEPTIGLHPRDTGRLLSALRELVDRGNSVLVVEHDADTIRAADHLIDVGPGGGRTGGEVIAAGPPAALLQHPGSVTGAALARPVSIPDRRRPVRGIEWLELEGAGAHNLRNVDARFPLSRFVAVTGVSGSGKSTLVRDVLLRSTRAALGLVADEPGEHRGLNGFESLSRAIEIDQTPIGRTPRSVPVTYVGIWDTVRKLFAGTPEARARGYKASRFSFNVKAGRCPDCEGQGALTVEMSFLPRVLVPCDTCEGRRFNSETLEVRLHGLSAGEVLDLEVAEALSVFSAVPPVCRPLQLLSDLGLGYLKLGQPSNTLSGGEAQRLKLVSELAVRGSGSTLYVMDEPTTGLHRDDVARLLSVLDRLVDRGDTVVVIEHHPDVILAADYVLDLGPEGGDGGGRVIARGTPEQVMKSKKSHTGAVLRRELGH